MGRIGMPIITQYYVVDMNMNVEPQAKGECHRHFFLCWAESTCASRQFQFYTGRKTSDQKLAMVCICLSRFIRLVLTDGQEQFCQPFQPRHGPRTDRTDHGQTHTDLAHNFVIGIVPSTLYLKRACLVVVVKPYTCGGIRASRCVPSSPPLSYASSRTAPPQRPPN